MLATRENLYQWPSLLINIKLCYKETDQQGDCIVNPPEIKLSIEKHYADEWDCYFNHLFCKAPGALKSPHKVGSQCYNVL